MIHFFDTHAHLNDDAFAADRNSVMQDCLKSGVTLLAEIACEPASWPKLETFYNMFPKNIIGVCGIHPQNADECSSENVNLLKEYLKKPFVKALGEIGLDYAREYCSKDVQLETLSQMLCLANESGMPAVFHCRDNGDAAKNAYGDLFLSLNKYWAPGQKTGFSGIFHCFSGDRAAAFKALDLGLLIAANGTLTYPKNYELRETFKAVGIKRLVVETDCPYLPPQSLRGKRNSPANIPEIAAALAQTCGEKEGSAFELLLHNSKTVYGIL